MTNEEILALFEIMWSRELNSPLSEKETCKAFFLAGIARGQQNMLNVIEQFGKPRDLNPFIVGWADTAPPKHSS